MKRNDRTTAGNKGTEIPFDKKLRNSFNFFNGFTNSSFPKLFASKKMKKKTYAIFLHTLFIEFAAIQDL